VAAFSTISEPVKGASVFAVRSTGLTLTGGRAVHSYDGEEDPTVRGAKTDSAGRFELAVGDPAAQGRPVGGRTASVGSVGPAVGSTPGLAVSSPALDAWPAPFRGGMLKRSFASRRPRVWNPLRHRRK